MLKNILTLFFILFCEICLGQFTVIRPQNRIVFQRNNQNETAVPITGICPSSANRIEIRAEAVQAGQGTSTGWLTADASPQNGRFAGMVTLKGGWYRLFVRALPNAVVLAEVAVERVGVGEVFIVAGQSNASGGHVSNPGAADHRVSVVDWFEDDLPEANLPLVFSQAATNRRMAPFNPLHMWGMLGDRLTSRLNVPVLFLGAAYGGTNSEVWRISAQGQNPGGSPGPLLMPYRPLGAALDHYVRRTGVRAVLWHQGESDNGYRGQQAYFDNVKAVIDKTRQQSGYARLPWVVSRVSYIGGRTDAAIIAGQNQLIQTVDQVWPGPETDAYTSTDDRFDGLHFAGNGLNRLTDLWDKCLTTSFFNQSAAGTLSAIPPAITTGSIIPIGSRAGQAISVPSVRQHGFAGDNQFVVKLFTQNGAFVQDLGSGTQNPQPIQIPGDIVTGQYSIRVDGTKPAATGTVSQVFTITGQTPTVTTPTTSAPGLVRRIAYEYDAPTHGFNLFADADGPTEVRVQRINGVFAANGWITANGGTFADSYNYTHYYPPASLGVGGIEPGQYLITARRIGQPTSEKSATITVTHGFRTIFPVVQSQAPVVTQLIPSQTATINQSFTFQIPANTFTDPDGDPLVYGIIGQPSGLTIDRNNLVGIPQQAGQFTITVRATDTKGLMTFTDFLLTVNSASTSPPVPTTTTSPPSTTSPAVVSLRKVGYKYDVPTHGFQLLVNADGPVEVRLERLDGSFSPSNWGTVVPYTNQEGYTAQRFYTPITLGVGGVEPGRYRLSARLINQPQTMISAEVVLQYGVFAVFTAPPPSTTTPTTPPNPFYVSRLGYKYDAPTHGFEVLVSANAAVQISIERTDGLFGPTDWQAGTTYTDQNGYNYRRFYPPIVPGVGGVVAGTYRLKARITGQPDSEVSVEVVLQYGVFQAYPSQKVLRQPGGKVEEPLAEAPLVPTNPNCGNCVPMQARRLNE
ncbi:MAG: putative Ig domain-containing protein [Rudanella sp.]|nr:putative Ig domain-containing protein [Rudanella sp.]